MGLKRFFRTASDACFIVAAYAFGAAIGTVIAATGCTTLYIGGDNTTQTVSGPGPLPSGSPGAGGNGIVATVTVNGFGNGNICPAGVQPPTGQREVKVGCRQAVTCNPRTADGKVIFDLNVTGPAPENFSVTSGDPSEFALDDVNPFNGEIHARSAGVLRLSCTVKGKTGTADFTVVP